MKKVYKIEVDCAVCANKITEAVNKVEGVKSANVNFMTQKMVIEFFDDVDVNSKLKEIKKLAKRIEPDFCVLD